MRSAASRWQSAPICCWWTATQWPTSAPFGVIALVIQGDKALSPAALYQAMGILPFRTRCRGGQVKPLAALLLALPLLAGADTTLRFCAAGSPKTFDPSMTDSGIDHVTHLPIFGTLVETIRGGDQLMPGLAAGWKISSDGLAYTFDLRRGVAWQSSEAFKPTREFNADDVLFTFGRLLNRDSAFAKALPGVSPYVASYGWEKLIQKVEKLGSHQVRITLAERRCGLPAGV